MEEKKLKELGLTDSEIEVYLFLLESGLSTPLEISRGTNVARTNTYPILRNLKKIKLIEERARGRLKAFIATDPMALVREAERKKEVLEQIVPDLRARYKTRKNKPQIKFYDGFEQVKAIYDRTLEAEKLLATGSTEKLEALSPGFIDWYRKKLRKNKVIMRDMVTSAGKDKTAQQLKDELGALYELRFLPERYKDIPTDMFIWGDNVALISLDEPIFGTIFTNKHLADTFRILYEMAWESAEG